MVPSEKLLPSVDAAIAAMSEPMVSHDCVAFYLLSGEVPKSVTVVQAGQGADEVFAGYDWYPPLADVPREQAVDAYARVFVDRPHASWPRSWSRSGCWTTTPAGNTSPRTLLTL